LGEAAVIAGREAVEYKELGAGSLELGEKESGIRKSEENLPASSSQLRASQEALRHRIEKYKIRLEDAGAAGGAEVMKEYRETEERDAFLGRELEDLKKAKDELLALIAELDTRIDIEFRAHPQDQF